MAAAPFCQMPPRNFPRRNWHLQVAERASGTKARKIIPPLFQFRLCLSLSASRSLPSPVRRCLPSLTLTCSQTELPSTHGNSCEETVLSVERGQIPHGGGGGGPAREENCGPGQRVEIREEKWLPFEPSVTSQLHTKSKSRLSRTCTDNLPLTLL